MRVERGLDERDAARAILYQRRPEGQRIGRRARLPRRSLTDNAVTISGKIELYKGKPEIVISSAAQIAKE